MVLTNCRKSAQGYAQDFLSGGNRCARCSVLLRNKIILIQRKVSGGRSVNSGGRPRSEWAEPSYRQLIITYSRSHIYRVAGIFRGGGKFSWMLEFLVIRGLKNLGRWVKSKPHPSYMCRAMASSFGVEAMVRGYHQYKQSGMHKLAKLLFPFFLKYRNNVILRAKLKLWHLQLRVLIKGYG